MIQKAGIDPVVMPASIIETFPSDMGPEDATMFLAMKKATAVLEEIKSSEGHDQGIHRRLFPFYLPSVPGPTMLLPAAV